MLLKFSSLLVILMKNVKELEFPIFFYEKEVFHIFNRGCYTLGVLKSKNHSNKTVESTVLILKCHKLFGIGKNWFQITPSFRCDNSSPYFLWKTGANIFQFVFRYQFEISFLFLFLDIISKKNCILLNFYPNSSR